MITSSGPGAGRDTWMSNFGFVMAGAGAAIGLGNLWRFPYITGENGGGLFVLIYLATIVLVGLPILISEIVIGRAAGTSTVSAFSALAGRRSGWTGIGALGVTAATLVLSVYSVVAGWAIHYAVQAMRGTLGGLDAGAVESMFGAVYADGRLSFAYGLLFLGLTAAAVFGGVRRGLERWSRILMPVLLAMLLLLFARALTLDGFGEAFAFVFGFHAGKLSPGGVLEALGHACFTLGVGVGIMLTYGSYLPRRANIIRDSVTIATLDTAIALLACLVIFPITFSAGLGPAEGPGLVFVSATIAFAQMPAGSILAALFFSLLVFAALTSSISMLEVPVSFLIDSRGWSRRRATIGSAGVVALLLLPAALTGAVPLFGSDFAAKFGKSWFDLVLDTVSNWMMPLGGLGFALFAGWRLRDATRRDQFPTGRGFAFYRAWLLVLRYLVPVAVSAVFLHAIGVL